MKILLVDDETAILDTLEILFRGEGYEVVVATSGPKALAALEDEKPDIVLTDIRMPGVTGLEVLAEARVIDPEIAVILMTAQASLQSAVLRVSIGFVPCPVRCSTPCTQLGLRKSFGGRGAM